MGRNNNVEYKSAAGRRSALLEAIALLSDRYKPKSDRSHSYEDRYYNKTVDDEDDDDFRMYEFKVRRCMRGRSHDWTDCPFAHPGEKAQRRDPRRFHYSGVACPDYRKGNCKRGDSCEYAHGVFECWLHPSRYRTQVCKDGMNCKRRVCFFAHSPSQLRLTQQASMSDSDIMLDIATTDYSSSPVSPQNKTQAVTSPPSDVCTLNFNDEQPDSMLSQITHHMSQAATSDSFLLSSSSVAMPSSMKSSGGFNSDPYSNGLSQNVSMGMNVPVAVSSPSMASCFQPAVISPQVSGRNIFAIPQVSTMATMGLPSTTMDAISGFDRTDSFQISNFNNNSASMTCSPSNTFHSGSFVGDSALHSPLAVGAGSFDISTLGKTMSQNVFSRNGYEGASIVHPAMSPMPAASYRDVAVMRSPLNNHMDQRVNNGNIQQLEAQLASKLKLYTSDFVCDHEFGFPSPTSTLIPPQAYSPPLSPLSSTNSDKAAEVSLHLNHDDVAYSRNIVDILYGAQNSGFKQNCNSPQFAGNNPIRQAAAPSVISAPSLISPLNIQEQKYENLHNHVFDHVFEMEQRYSPLTSHFALSASQQSAGINNVGLNCSTRRCEIPSCELEMNLLSSIRRNICRDSNIDQINQLTPDVDWVTDLVN